MVCPDVFEMLHLDAVVEHQLQGFGADTSVPIRLSYPVAHLAVVFTDRDIAGFMCVVAHAADSLSGLFQDDCAHVVSLWKNVRIISRLSSTDLCAGHPA